MKVRHEKPINATAARVVSRGEQHEYMANNTVDSALPLPIRDIDTALMECPSFDDLTGKRIGRLVVAGLSIELRRWVCRCDCGTYTLRTTKALKNGSAAPCGQCYMLARAKRQEFTRRTGKHAECEDFL